MTGTIHIEGVPFNYSTKNGMASVTHLPKDQEALESKEQTAVKIQEMIPVGNMTGSGLRDILKSYLLKNAKAKAIMEDYHNDGKKE